MQTNLCSTNDEIRHKILYSGDWFVNSVLLLYAAIFEAVSMATVDFHALQTC